MEKKIYDERALNTFKANFEKVRDSLMHVHECDLGLVGFRNELIVQLYKACDYRCLYRFMPTHEIGVMEQGRLISRCSDYILRDFISYFLRDIRFKPLRYCCVGLYRDDDDIEIEFDLQNPQLWFDGLSNELKREFEKEAREIWDLYGFVMDEDDTITEGRVSELRGWYGMGWTTVLEWVMEHHRLDELKRFIWDTYVKKDVSAVAKVAKRELEEHIDFCSDEEDWWLDESFEAVYNCRGQISKWFEDPKVQKDFLLSGKSIGDWLKENINEWLKVKCSSNWFHLKYGKD